MGAFHRDKFTRARQQVMTPGDHSIERGKSPAQNLIEARVAAIILDSRLHHLQALETEHAFSLHQKTGFLAPAVEERVLATRVRDSQGHTR